MTMKVGLNPMLRFRTCSEELSELALGYPLAIGSNQVFIHDGRAIAGAKKVFRTGDSSFTYENCGMNYYNLHGSADNKRKHVSESIVTLWEASDIARLILSIMSKD